MSNGEIDRMVMYLVWERKTPGYTAQLEDALVQTHWQREMKEEVGIEIPQHRLRAQMGEADLILRDRGVGYFGGNQDWRNSTFSAYGLVVPDRAVSLFYEGGDRTIHRPEADFAFEIIAREGSGVMMVPGNRQTLEEHVRTGNFQRVTPTLWAKYSRPQ